MRPAYQLQPVRLVELLRDALIERVAGTARRGVPVQPEQVADRALVRNLHEAVELADLVKGVDAGRESTVQAENFIGHDSCKRQIVKQLEEHMGEVPLQFGLAVEWSAFGGGCVAWLAFDLTKFPCK